ncbi:MAG: conjugal transfer protein TraF [Lentimicrobiaceae bacterium]|nr:conjugal transfer protein TraF [Lentimicrobiaceae bacterium]
MLKKTLLLAICTALTHVAPVVSAQDTRPGFYERKQEGWFFYEVEPEEPEIKIIEEPPIPEPPMAQTPPEPIEETPAQPTPPPAFSSQWLRENMPKYLEAAIDNPTIENVSTYLYLQRIAMDKSHVYSQMAQLAVVGNPFLDEATNRPFAAFASQDLDRKAGIKSAKTVKLVGERAGLFFFFKSDCESCMIKKPILDIVAKMDQFSVVPISMDGANLQNYPFDNFRVDDGHAQMFGVQNLPALYLVTPDGIVSPVAQTMLSLDELRERILVVARRENIISQEEFNQTKPLLNTNFNLSQMIQENQNDDLLQQITTTHGDESGYVDPTIISKLIQDQISKGIK